MNCVVGYIRTSTMTLLSFEATQRPRFAVAPFPSKCAACHLMPSHSFSGKHKPAFSNLRSCDSSKLGKLLFRVAGPGRYERVVVFTLGLAIAPFPVEPRPRLTVHQVLGLE
jgi:hypothetical protein